MDRTRMRTTTDGLPYYCKACGAGWNEYGACDDVACELEPSSRSEARRTRDRPAGGNPGGMQCQECFEIFIGAEWHDYCAVCEERRS
jgi:hypothetical protein